MTASVQPPNYAASGVNIDAGNRAVELIRAAVQSTHGPEVVGSLGQFGGLFDASALKNLANPVLVASTDGVGTKLKVAAQTGQYESVGHDLVNHCVNDILVQGGHPLFLLDYVATSRLEPEMATAVVRGIAAACRAAGCALLGGEMAELPGVYAPGEFDVVGTVVGLVDRDEILPRGDIQAGDVLIGLPSSGPHTNGYSLIRRVFEGVPLDTLFPELGTSLADALMAPHRSYLYLLESTLDRHPSPVKALAHITGGSFIDNVPRVLPQGLDAVIRLDSWPVPSLFHLIQERGGVSTEEMYRVFNMGVGMLAIVAPEEVRITQEALGEESWVVGELVEGQGGVILA